MYGIKRIVMGENKTFVGGESWLKHEGCEVINLESEECYELLQRFITEVCLAMFSAIVLMMPVL